jgi:hypothetical protein
MAFRKNRVIYMKQHKKQQETNSDKRSCAQQQRRTCLGID